MNATSSCSPSWSNATSTRRVRQLGGEALPPALGDDRPADLDVVAARAVQVYWRPPRPTISPVSRSRSSHMPKPWRSQWSTLAASLATTLGLGRRLGRGPERRRHARVAAAAARSSAACSSRRRSSEHPLGLDALDRPRAHRAGPPTGSPSGRLGSASASAPAVLPADQLGLAALGERDLDRVEVAREHGAREDRARLVAQHARPDSGSRSA